MKGGKKKSISYFMVANTVKETEFYTYIRNRRYRRRKSFSFVNLKNTVYICSLFMEYGESGDILAEPIFFDQLGE